MNEGKTCGACDWHVRGECCCPVPMWAWWSARENGSRYLPSTQDAEECECYKPEDEEK